MRLGKWNQQVFNRLAVLAILDSLFNLGGQLLQIHGTDVSVDPLRRMGQTLCRPVIIGIQALADLCRDISLIINIFFQNVKETAFLPMTRFNPRLVSSPGISGRSSCLAGFGSSSFVTTGGIAAVS